MNNEPKENYAIAGYLFDHDCGGTVKVFRADDPAYLEMKRNSEAWGKLEELVKQVRPVICWDGEIFVFYDSRENIISTATTLLETTEKASAGK